MADFSSRMAKTLNEALGHASDRRHEYATLEHLLLALIDDKDAAAVMEGCGAELDTLDDVIRQYLDQEYQSLKTRKPVDPQPTAGFQQVMQRAIIQVESSGRKTVTGTHVFAALFSEPKSYAVHFLQEQGLSRDTVESYVRGKHKQNRTAQQLQSTGEPHDVPLGKAKSKGLANNASPNAEPNRQALPKNTRLDRYQVEKVLGQGGFGITYLAKHTTLQHHVAIKEYFPRGLVVRDNTYTVHPVSETDRTNYEWGLERFETEAKLLKNLKHPNVVAVTDLFSANGTAYIIMEYCEGESLDNILQREGVLDSVKIQRLFKEMKSALKVVHKEGIIHRDIKPGNIFIKDNGQAILLDFGSARPVSDGTNMTALVSAGYAPIEQYSGTDEYHDAIDATANFGAASGPWTDIYSLAATLYHAATGEKPQASISRLRRDRLVPVYNLAQRKYPTDLLEAIGAGLALQPEDRPQRVQWWGNKKTEVAKSSIVTGVLIGTLVFLKKTAIYAGWLAAAGAALVAGAKIENSSLSLEGITDFIFGPTVEVTQSEPSRSEPSSDTASHNSSEPAAEGMDAKDKAEKEQDRALYQNLKAAAGAAAQSMAQCQGSEPLKFDKCFASYTDADVIYNGSWVNGRFEGLGVAELSDGSMYVGYYKAGRRSGRGVEIYPNGEIFIGSYSRGLPNGSGARYTSDWNPIKRCEFRQGSPISCSAGGVD